MPLDLSVIAPHLARTPDGFWVTSAQSAVSYPREGNEQCFAVEDGSFWFAHRNRCILHLLRSYPSAGTFFDIGGGNGYVARAVQSLGIEVVLLEPGREGAVRAKARGIRHIIQGTFEDAGLLPETIGAGGLFDVLEHLEDDRRFLCRLNVAQPRGGRLYITVPAHTFLWSREDEMAGHRRRYSLDGLKALLKSAGYEVEYATYFFGFLVVPILFFRTIPARLGFGPREESFETVKADHQIRSELFAGVLQKLMAREEARIARGKMMALGGSCLAVARKKANT
jgi:hypothetical protein